MINLKAEKAPKEPEQQQRIVGSAAKSITEMPKTPAITSSTTLTSTTQIIKAKLNGEQQKQNNATKGKNQKNNSNNSKLDITNGNSSNNKNKSIANKKVTNNKRNGNNNSNNKIISNNNAHSRNFKEEENSIKNAEKFFSKANTKKSNKTNNVSNKNKLNNLTVINNKNSNITNEKYLLENSNESNASELEDIAQSSSNLDEKENFANPADLLTAALNTTCAKCSKVTTNTVFAYDESISSNGTSTQNYCSTDNVTTYAIVEPLIFTNTKQYRKSKSYVGTSRHNSVASISSLHSYGDSYQQQHRSRGGNNNSNDSKSTQNNNNNNKQRHQYYRRLYSDRRSSFNRNFAQRNKDFVPIAPPTKPVLSSSNISAVICDAEKFVVIERFGKERVTYPIMQCGTLDAPDSSYHQQRSNRMDAYQIDDGFHSDGGTETPPPSPSSGSSIASTSDHGSLESVDTGGTQRLAVLSFDQVRKLHDVMDEKVAIHGRGNFPTLEVTLKDLVNLVRRKLETDVAAGGAGVTVKDIRLNGGAASHVLASEDQSYNDLDLIYAIEFSSSRHFDRVKTAVLNTLLDLLPEGVSKRRIMPSALKEAYVGKMVKVNNNNDGDRWSLISLGNSPGHKNVELKFVDTMRRQFEFSVDSFQIVLDSLLLFYDCATLPISENFYPTVVGESVYGDFQEALYHLQKKMISTRQPEEIRGGGLLKYCNLLVRNYKPVDPQRIKTLERYMCSRFFIDFPDINTQTVKLEAYLRNHFWGIEEEPLQYEYLMHLREVVGNSTVCLMGHERRQTLQLIESLATQVLYKEHQKQNPHLQEQQYQHDLQQHQQQSQTVTYVTTTTATQHQQAQQQQITQTATIQPQTIYVHQAPQNSATTTTATICCTLPATTATVIETQQQPQTTTHHHQHHQQGVANATTTTATVPQTIQIQAGPPGLIYANGVYYAPVIPTTICTCNSTWLST